MNQRFLIIIPATDRENANAVAKSQFDSLGGEKTFAIGLSVTGNAPATHYWCSALFSDLGSERLAAASALFPEAVVLGYNADSNPTFPRLTLAELGLKQIVTIPSR
jgi:hypothetical protein